MKTASIHRSVQLIALLAGALTGAPALAAELPRAGGGGFYGGIGMRDSGAEQGITLGDAGRRERFSASVAEIPVEQTTIFGGYRWGSDLALEASLGTDGYRLPGAGGVGLMLPGGTDPLARTWNLDVYGSWAFARNLSLYGRLGYAMADSLPTYSTAIIGNRDGRQREGLNYGVGLRYDLGRSLGLRLEYARVGPTTADNGNMMLPETDQVQFGIQLRF